MIKRLSKSVREFKKTAILTPITVTFEVILEVVIPMLMASLIDSGINKGDMNYILKMGLILIGCCVLSLIFGALAGKFASTASAGFARNLRHDMFDKVQDFSFSNIDKYSTSSLITRLTTDVTNVQNSFQMITRIAVRCPMMLIFAMVMSFSINAQLSLIFVCALPVLAVGLYLIMSKVHPIFMRVFKKYDRLNGVVQENLRGIRVVKSYVREEHEDKKFKKVSGEIYGDFVKAEKLMALGMPLMQFVVYACILLVSFFGARLIIGSGGTDMTTGQLMSLISYASQILMSMMMLSMVFVMITMSRASAERIVEVLDEQPDIVSPENPVETVPSGDVDFENVCFSYSKERNTKVLKNINLHIKQGQTVGIIGGTGSAKSSLVQLIPRLYDATEGCVKVGGTDVRRYELSALRREVAMVLQKNVLFSGTIRENLRWGNENATDEEIEHACRVACADGFISSFPEGYDTYIEQGGTNVSGGQKQRLCIARALLAKPKVIIMDDSTSAVDTHTDSMIRSAFAQELPDTTKIIIAQRLSSVQDADMIVVMDEGAIAAAGTHEELMESCDIYREVYTSQNKGGDAQ
ncbi:MAG: ABC transporter ATP-binding protein [Firmicutes bacterium]|nr:ABC transporter ATP-binding protein [Bacillota bacterium]